MMCTQVRLQIAIICRCSPAKVSTDALRVVGPAVTKLPKPIPRDSIRLGLPSKGRMAEDTMQLLKVKHIMLAAADIRAPTAALGQCLGHMHVRQLLVLISFQPNQNSTEALQKFNSQQL
jgi:hypothetical protein